MFGLFKKKPLKSESFGINWADVKQGQLVGLNVNEKDENQTTPLALAVAWCDDMWVFNTLINAGADVNADNGLIIAHSEGCLIGSAIYRDKIEVVKLLVKSGAHVSSDLLYLVQTYKAFKWLLDNTLDGYISPVISTNLLSDLLHRPNDYSGLYGTVYDPKPNDDDMFLIARDLIGLGANVNLVDGEGRTAMHRVVKHKHSDKTVLLLLETDANINNEDEDEHTPFNHAAFHYGPKIISQFIRHGGNVNNGVLVSAADDNTSGEVIKLLVTAGADVNYKDPPDDVTPLHAATLHCKSFEVIKALVECGADVNAITKGYEISPYTPIENVRRNISLSEGLSSDGKSNAIDLEILDYLEGLGASHPITMTETTTYVPGSSSDPYVKKKAEDSDLVKSHVKNAFESFLEQEHDQYGFLKFDYQEGKLDHKLRNLNHISDTADLFIEFYKL